MIVRHSGNNGDNAICIAVSGRQTTWNYTATPAKYFEDPSHRPSGAYAQALGEGANRFQRGHLVYQNMGHTAVYTRMMGLRKEPVVGFFPKEGLLGSLSPDGFTAHNGGAVKGAWHNDGWMFDDNAALCFEISASSTATLLANKLLKQKLDSPDTQFNYQTRQDPGDDQNAARNCVAAALLLLEEISTYCLQGITPENTRTRKEILRVTRQMKALLSERGYLQGQMQQLVQTGFTHLPSSGD